MPKLTCSQYTAALRLARRLSISSEILFTILNSKNGSADFYEIWQKPKKSGGYRVMHTPQSELMRIQNCINDKILVNLPISPIVHGFIKGRGIVSNAEAHWKAKSMIAVDITDAFGSSSFFKKTFHISYPGWGSGYTQRLKLFNDFGLGANELLIIEKVIDYYDSDKIFLPQGAPTSPAIFNYLCSDMDRLLEKLAGNVGGTVTRYADNIFFSMPKPYIDRELANAVCRIIEDCGFQINPDKTRFFSNANRQGVPLRLLGINLMEGSPYLPPETIREYRSLLYRAGMECDRETLNWVRGVVFNVYAGWPAQLRGVYYKGLLKGGHITEKDS